MTIVPGAAGDENLKKIAAGTAQFGVIDYSGALIRAGRNAFDPFRLVAGLNNQTCPNGVTVPDPFIGTCTTCHDTPNAGNHSVKAPLDLGLTDAARRTADMPLYTLRRISTSTAVRQHGVHYAAPVVTRAESRGEEKEWFLRALLVLQSPRRVFAALRDDSDEIAAARQDTAGAIVWLAGIAAVHIWTHRRKPHTAGPDEEDEPTRRFSS